MKMKNLIFILGFLTFNAYAQPGEFVSNGGTGLLVKSIASFSSIDVESANDDAALRFLNSGALKYIITTFGGDLSFYESGSVTPKLSIQSGTGNVTIQGTISKGGGSFKIDHPVHPETHYLYHSFVESPDMMNVYNGNVVIDASGEATVNLPEYFEALNTNFRYQLTPIGHFAPLYIKKEIHNNQFVIAGGEPDMKVSWQVTGVRHDPFANRNRIKVEVEKPARERGHYLHPEAYNAPSEIGIWKEYDDNQKVNADRFSFYQQSTIRDSERN